MRLLVICCAIVVAVSLFIVLPAAFSSGDSAAFPASVLRREHSHMAQFMERRATEASDSNDDNWISWSKCRQLGPDKCAYRRVTLVQRDFRDGTLRVKHPCILRLGEDIVFNPNAQHDHRVSEQQRANGDYPERSAFVLGFFAAIFFESHHIVLDLNGRTLSQSSIFAAKQAFYTHVALSPPFIVGEGPADFSEGFVRCHHIIVKNGKLARSSHHGIHGNGASYVFVENLEISNYEIAAIALNGCENAVISNVRALGTFNQVPELGTLSQARFLLPALDRLAHVDETVRQSMHRLRILTEQAAADIERYDRIRREVNPAAYKLFANENGISDGGSSYGMIITDLGSAVHAFGTEYIQGEGSRHVLIENTLINGTANHSREVLCTRLADGSMRPLAGPFGDIIEFQRVIKKYNGRVADDPVTHAQFALASAVAEHVGPADRARNFPTLTLLPELIRWFRATNGGQADVRGELAQLYAAKKLIYTRRGDQMDHFSKGAIGLRLDSSYGTYLYNVVIEGTRSEGEESNTEDLPGETGEPEQEHPLQLPFVGYHGNVATGILLAGMVDVHMKNVRVGDVYSRTGKAYLQRDVGSTVLSL